MRSHCALYVDAGYLVAAAATRVVGSSLRSGVVISYPDLVARLIAYAEALSGVPVLRVNWYDAGSRNGHGPDPEQDRIGMLPRVKLRLGRTSPQGEQKGVDLRIGLDLATHGRNRVVDVMYLVSGDDDLTEAVEEAQSHGVQVIVLAVPDGKGQPHAVSRHLIRESDGIEVIDAALIDATVHVRTQVRDEPRPSADDTGQPIAAPLDTNAVAAEPGSPYGPNTTAATAGPATPAPKAPTPADLASAKPATGPSRPASSIPSGQLVWSSTSGQRSSAALVTDAELGMVDAVCRGVVAAWRLSVTETERRTVVASRPFIPAHLDRTLLTDLSARLEAYDVPDRLRRILREHFWEVVDRTT